MKKRNEYIEHIKERWSFAQKTVEEQLKLKNHVATNVALSIFDKCLSPYHYFLGEDVTTNGDSPTEKQIAYAKKLGISDSESYTKSKLSEKIDEVVKNG